MVFPGFRILFAAACLLCSANLSAQIRINEVFADNKSVLFSDGSITDWFELVNTSSQPISLAGYSVTDTLTTPRRWVFPEGLSIPANGYLTILLDSSRPATTTSSPVNNAGFGIKASGDRLELYGPGATPVLVDSVRFGPQAADNTIGRIPSGTGDFTLTRPTPNGANIQQSTGSQSTLRINEWMASPSSGSDWFEVYNPDPLPVQLSGLHFKDNGNIPSAVAALSFIGTGTEGFLQMFADNSSEDNEVAFGLSANGDSIGLYRADNSQIDRVQFAAQQPGVSEGRLPDGSETIMRLGVPTPGDSNLILYPGLIVNELLSHTDPPYEDAVEFYNTTGSPVPIGGWYLSNSRSDLKRYRIPDNTVVPANGYLVIYENQFNGAGAITPFTFNSWRGDQVYLAQAVNGNLTGYIVQESFEAAENGVSFGRVLTSVPDDYKFVALRSPTFGVSNPTSVEQFRTGTGGANSEPRIGPVIINEIMYNPISPDGGVTDNTNDEFIELLNIASTNVPLYDPLYPTNEWRIQGGVQFDFPALTTVQAGEAILVVSFDPAANPNLLAAFRSKYGVPESVRVFGPYTGKLGNNGDEIELYKPDAPQLPGRPEEGFVPYIRGDKVNYTDVSPWPSGADGTGSSILRKVATAFGNDAINWEAGSPTPGRVAGGNGSVNISLQRVDSDSLELSFNTIGGKTYSVEFKENLSSTAWQPLTTVTGTGGEVRVAESPSGVAQRYYRVVTN